jgi:hypothetical protein
MSEASYIRPDTGTGDAPASNAFGAWASAWYSSTRARILPRSAAVSSEGS